MPACRSALANAATAIVVSTLGLALLAGCSGTPGGRDLIGPAPDPTDPADPSDPSDPPPTVPPACPAIAPACDQGDYQAASEGECKTLRADYCYSRATTCNGAVTSTIWCARLPAQCTAVPTCDAGDKQVTQCSDGVGVSCYNRSMCGSTILCMHQEQCKALPTCDAGDTPYATYATCQQSGKACYSRTTCGTTIWCANTAP